MKRGVQLLFLFSTLFILSNCKKADQHKLLYNKSYIDEIKAARKDVGFFIASNFIPGASVSVIKDGELIYSEAFGFASKDLEVKATRDTKFRIGSMSEIFTNVIYQKLVEEGVIHPDSSIQTYLPDFPIKQYRINLKYLAHHMSGIRKADNHEMSSSGKTISIETGLETFKDDPLANPPTVYQEETIFDYNLLGVIMEKATGKAYANLLKEYVTDTLHLNNTVIDNPVVTIKNRSDFYDLNFIAQVVNATSFDLRRNAPSNGLLSTSDDLANLGWILLNSDYLSEETRAQYFKSFLLYGDFPSTLSNSWILMEDNQGQPYYGKIGEVRGGSSTVVLYPEYGLVIAYASNVTSSRNQSPVFKIASHFLPQPEETKTSDK